MNPTLFMEPFSALLEALLNTFVASAAVVAVAWGAMRLLKSVNAATRYAAWWAVLVAIVAIAAAPFVPAFTSAPAAVPAANATAPLIAGDSAIASKALAAGDLSAESEPFEVPAGEWILGVFAVWAVVLLWRSARIVRSYIYVRGLRRRARLAPPEIASVFDRRRMEIGIKRPARLLVSAEVPGPMAIGFRRPVVILPESLLAEFDAAEMEHVLLHELSHIARYDDWTNLLTRAASAVFGLHPAAAFVIGCIDRERENACDDWVVEQTGAARRYAASLTRVLELTYAAKPLLASGMAERGSKLGARVERLLERGRKFSSGVSMEILGISTLMLMGLVFAAAQSPTWIAFARDNFDLAKEPALRGRIGPDAPLPAVLAYYQQVAPLPPVAATEPQSPAEAPAAPKPAVAPRAPRSTVILDGTELPAEALIQLRERQTEIRAIESELRSAEQAAKAANTAQNRAKVQELRARTDAARRSVAMGFSRRPLVQELIDAGMTNLSVDEIVQMAQNGISPTYLKALTDLGWKNLSRDQIIAFQQNGITASYLRELKESGADDLTPAEVIQASQNGVRGRDIKTARTYKPGMSLGDIIKLKQNGAL